MADYKLAINPVLKSEGGYANDPDDRGGETYKGISRNNWPSWEGWEVIDREKRNKNFPKSLANLVFLHDMVLEFYKINFWDKIGGDNLKSQAIAKDLVDSAINEGIKPAVKRAEGIVGLPKTGIFSNLLISKLNSL